MNNKNSAEGAHKNPFEFNTYETNVNGTPSKPFTLANMNLHFFNKNGRGVGHSRLDKPNMTFKSILNLGIAKTGWQVAVIGDKQPTGNVASKLMDGVMKTNVSSIIPIEMTREVFSRLKTEALYELDENTSYTEIPSYDDRSTKGVTVSNETWNADREKFHLVEVNRSYNGNSIVRCIENFCVIIFYSDQKFDPTCKVTSTWSKDNAMVDRQSTVYLTMPLGNTSRVQGFIAHYLGSVDQLDIPSDLQLETNNAQPSFTKSGVASLDGGAAMAT